MSAPELESRGLNWTLGISAAKEIQTLEKENILESNYEGHVEVTDKDTLFALTNVLCDGPIKNRREVDHGVNDHLWELTIHPPGKKLGLLSAQKSISPEVGVRTDPKSEKCIGPNENHPPVLGEPQNDNGDESIVKVSTKVGELRAFQVGSVLHLKYDMGSTTNLFLVVLSAQLADAYSSLHIVEDFVDDIVDQQAMKGVPAFVIAKDKQIDSFFPKFSAAFLGKTQKLNAALLGLCSCVSREDDTLFAAMEAPGIGDVFSCPHPFESVDEFLVLAEESWGNNHSDRCLFPPTPHGKVAYEKTKENTKGDPSKKNTSLFYKPKIKPIPEFSFSTTFPHTAEQFTNGRFRWIKYQKGLLQVMVGRMDRNRSTKKAQVLRSWKRDFDTLHDLLCAVEASWTVPDDSSKGLGNTVLQLYDSYLGPSDPLPPKPPILGRVEEAVVVSPPNDLPRVTAAALISTFLYTGHHDGSIRKWDLNTNMVLWRVKVFRDWSQFTNLVNGVRGITIHESDGGSHSLYTWSHFIEDETWEDRKPAKIKVVRENGTLSHILSCQVGEDDSNPLVNCITHGLCADNGSWKDTLFVGLEASALVDSYQTNYEDYDIEYSQDIAEGNILPFDIVSRKRLETWRGHRGPIRSLAAVTQKYLVSVSECPRTLFPESLILWDLKHPGVPLQRIDFYTEDERGKYPPFDCLIGGIAVHENKVVLGCDYGGKIVPIDLENGVGDPSLKPCGHAKLIKGKNEDVSTFRGCMAGIGNLSALASGVSGEVYIFSIDTLATSPFLDRDMTKKFSHERENDDVLKVLQSRAMATGVIQFPMSCGVKSRKRKVSRSIEHVGEADEGDDDDCDDWLGYGSGAPECIAMSGKWIVATYGNGGIMKSALPKEVAIEGNAVMRASTRPACGTEDFVVPHMEYLDNDDENNSPAVMQRDPGAPCSMM